MAAQKAVPAKSFLENLQDILNPTRLMQKIQNNKETLFHIALFIGIGFLVGYFIKKYNRYVAGFVFVALALIGLDYIGILSITVQWQRIHDLFGIEPVMRVEGNIFAFYAEWIRANFFIAVSFCVVFSLVFVCVRKVLWKKEKNLPKVFRPF